MKRNFKDGVVSKENFGSRENNMKTFILFILIALAGTRSFAGVIFSDNFNDNTIDPAKWTVSGNTVSEGNQTMQVLTTVTDAGGNLNSVAIPVNQSGVITISRKVSLHYANSNFAANMAIRFGDTPWAAIYYANATYSNSGWMPRFGTFIGRNVNSVLTGGAWTHVLTRSTQSDVSNAFPVSFDMWLNEKIIYTPMTGVLQYYVNDQKVTDYSIGIMPTNSNSTMQLNFRAWGWFTGHKQLMDDLVVTQDAPTPTAILTFYHESGGLLGAAGEGHSFIGITNKNGATLFAGFYCDDYQYYFANVPEIGFSGVINDDQNAAWDYKISYPITDAQYKSALAVIAHDQQSPPRYWLIGFNCMDWVAKVATAAGIQLPQYKYLYTGGLTISDPLVFYTSLAAMGNGTTYMGGTVTSNQASFAQLLSASSPVTTPVDYSYSGLESAGHADPATLATSIGIPYDHVNLGTVNANSVNGISLSLGGADATHNLISMKWGDGSALQEQLLTLSHVYASGTYAAQLLVIDAGAVHSYDMSVVVSSSTSAAVSANVTPLAPVSIPNQGLVPASLGPDFLGMQTTSVSVLTNGHALATVLGIPTLTYTIDATSDLTQGFLPVATVAAGADGTFQYDDPAAVGARCRFYRATFP